MDVPVRAGAHPPVHLLPMRPCRYCLKMRLFKPRSASVLQSWITYITGYRAEFADSKFPSYGEGREGEASTGSLG